MRGSSDTLTRRGSVASGDHILLGAIRAAGGWLTPLVLLAILGAAATLATPAALGRALDRVVTAVRTGEPAWATAGTSLGATAALVLVAVTVEVASQLVAGAGTARTTGRLRHQLAQHVLAAGPGLADRTPRGDLVTRLTGGTATAAKGVAASAGLASAAIPPAGAIVALGLIDPWLVLTFSAGMATAAASVRTYLRTARAATAGYLSAQGEIAARLSEALAGARTIAAARTTDQEIERVLVPLDELHREGTVVWRNLARLAFRGEPAVLLTQVAVVAVAGARLAAGHLTAGELLAASRYAVMAAGISGMLDKLAALARARAASDRLADALASPLTAHGERALPEGPGTLELRAITAGPPDSPVLAGLDLLVPGGCSVALVGRSGTGKSLVAALAGRLCDPHAGEVRLDGVPLTDLDHGSLRRAVSFAFARPALLGATVADALRFGVDVPPPQRVAGALRAAQVDGVVGRLPHGEAARLADTPLSGGELQRIGLARALAHDARVLILDDATSSLDTATEAQITSALTAQMAGRTRLIVTHRRATAARADLVAWLDGGRIRACAPHRVLWTDPAYRALYRPEPVDEPDEPPDQGEPPPDPEPVSTATPAGPTAGASTVLVASGTGMPRGPGGPSGPGDPGLRRAPEGTA